ncbi:DNA polymerase [Variovorax paradoxus]|uniref:DNA polymerase n=1 Tax=Variovorax paradoxus TaxID=34073 RepID=UPI002857FC41|nr:DNA polymerase [Variovorax paradoxus]MDR6455511.1 DNA polymerase-1 [Variovorax paradoxus]
MIEDRTEDDLVWDLETNGLLMELDRIWVMSIGNVRTGDVVTYTDHDPRFPSLADGVKRLSSHVKRQTTKRRCTVAHNGINFDRKALKKVTGVDIPLWAIFDTMVMGRLRDPERLGGHKLESYGIEMGILKGVYDGGWDAYSEDMRAYCGQDSVVTIALFNKLRNVTTWGEAVDLEHWVSFLIDLQMENGFRLDVRGGVRLAAEIDQERQALIAELQRVFPPMYVGAGTKTPKKSINYKATDKRPAYSVVEGAPFTEITLQEFNPGSEYHVDRRLFRKYGYRLPTTDKGNPNMTEAVLKKLHYPEAALLVKFSRAEKRWSQLAGPPKVNKATGRQTGGGWLHHADDNDRVHGYVNSNGAVTGRMTHRMPNSANIDKDPKMRALWIPRELWKLCGIDAEGLELRVLAHYLARYDGGILMRQLLEGDKNLGTDAHSVNRRNTDLASRDGAKTLLYGSLYGAGDEKAGNIWIADWRASGKPEDEWPAWAFDIGKRTGARRLKSATAIGKVVKARLINGIKGFKQLKDDIAAAAKERGWLKGIDGRRIRVRHAHAALNTLLQGTGAIVMKRALVILYEDLTERGLVHGVDYGFCANVHDEWQIECRPELAELIGKAGMAAITRAGEHFNFRCRLDGAFDIGTNWHETH